MGVSSCSLIIEQLFRKNGRLKRLKGELSVYYWPKIVGPEIAAKTEASYFRNGFLYITTDNPALAHQLSLLSEDILKKYQVKLGSGVLKGVRIKIGYLEPIEFNEKVKLAEPQLNEESRQLIAKCTDSITDAELAKRFKQAMQSSMRYHQRVLANGGQHCRSCNVVINDKFEYCPSCERKLKNEAQIYLDYFKKNPSEVNAEELKIFKELNHPQMKKLQSKNGKGED